MSVPRNLCKQQLENPIFGVKEPVGYTEVLYNSYPSPARGGSLPPNLPGIDRQARPQFSGTEQTQQLLVSGTDVQERLVTVRPGITPPPSLL